MFLFLFLPPVKVNFISYFYNVLLATERNWFLVNLTFRLKAVCNCAVPNQAHVEPLPLQTVLRMIWRDGEKSAF